LGEDSLRLTTQLIDNVYEAGEWPRYFIEVTIIALKNKPNATKCIDHSTISLIAHTAKIVEGHLEEEFKGKSRVYFEKMSLNVEIEKELGVQLGCLE
jgi:hypothetical protein